MVKIMAKNKVTKKSMKESYDKIAKVSYCRLQYLLRFQEAFAYSTRSEGWSCDYYDINGVLISEGYAPIESKRTNCTYDICKKYDDEACKVLCDYSLSYEEQKEKVDSLLNDFIAEITKRGGDKL